MFKKLAIAAGSFAMLGFAWGPAQAGVLTEVDLLDGSGTTLAANVKTIDWFQDASGGVLGTGSFGTPLLLGQKFQFVFEAQLVGASDTLGNAIPFGTLLNDDGAGDNLIATEYQFTIVASFEEIVTFVSLDGSVATFGLGPAGGTISIFFDEFALLAAGTGGTEGDIANGDGFDDGIEIARFTLQSVTSIFTAAPGGGIGGATLDAQLVALLDIVDADYILGLDGEVFDLHFTSSLSFPPPANTLGFHIGGSGFYPDIIFDPLTDFLLQVDGFNTFSRIPEPATILLFGIGLALLGFSARRRRLAA